MPKKIVHDTEILPLDPLLLLLLLLLWILVRGRWGGGADATTPATVRSKPLPSDRCTLDLIHPPSEKRAISAMPPIGLTLSFSGCFNTPPHHSPNNENLPTYTLIPPPPYLSTSSLSLYLSLFISFSLSPKIIESPHLLVSWWPATLQSWYLLSLSLRSTLLLPLRSDLLAQLLSASFFSVLFHYASTESSYYSQLWLLGFVWSVSSLIISDCSAHALLW